MSELNTMSTKLPAIPDSLLAKREQLIQSLGVDPKDSRKIASAVMMLSDFYVKNPQLSSPWDEDWAQLAYVAYYLPLNYLRSVGVIQRGVQLSFFSNIYKYLDFGSGLGSVGLAFQELGLEFKAGTCIERSLIAQKLHQKLSEDSLTPLTWANKVHAEQIDAETLAVFSYSFTELRGLPDWVEQAGALLLIEPSTKEDGRRLQKVRSQLLKDGWYIWGPCIHQNSCPLLDLSERDWCHDRFFWDLPEWMIDIERYMPIRNRTLPCSWMMFRKIPPPMNQAHLGRFVGDLQTFKGYSKQMICRGEQREFVSWQNKNFPKGHQEYQRGDLVVVDQEILLKGNELRPFSDDQLKKFKYIND